MNGRYPPKPTRYAQGGQRARRDTAPLSNTAPLRNTAHLIPNAPKRGRTGKETQPTPHSRH